MMPLEIELLLTAWDNAKKNVFEGEGWNIDPETGEVLTGVMTDDLGDLVEDLDDKMMDLIAYYRHEDLTAAPGFVDFSDEDDDVAAAASDPAIMAFLDYERRKATQANLS